MELTIDALKEAAAWPDADRRTLVVLAGQLMAAELYQEGFDYFAARSGSTPADALWLALAGAFESRLDGLTEAAIARLAARPDAGRLRGLVPGLRNPRPDGRRSGGPGPVRAADHRLLGDRRRRVPVRAPQARRARAGRARRPGI